MIAYRALPAAFLWAILFALASAFEGNESPAEKKHILHFEKAAWSDVFKWYAAATGLKAELNANPEGEVTLTPGKDRSLTQAEVLDLLNNELMKQQMILIPSREKFTVVAAGGIDPSLVRRLDVKDLGKYPRTMMAETVLSIPGNSPIDEHAAELKKYVGLWGDVVNVAERSITIRAPVETLLRAHLIWTET